MKAFHDLPPVKKAAVISAVGVIGASAVLGVKKAEAIADYFSPTPETTLANAGRTFAEANLTPSQCYPAVVESGGVIGDLIAEIQDNEELDIDQVRGYEDAGDDINDVLAAMHEISDSDHHDVVQIGDKYDYCVLDDGTVISGDPSTFVIVSR